MQPQLDQLHVHSVHADNVRLYLFTLFSRSDMTRPTIIYLSRLSFLRSGFGWLRIPLRTFFSASTCLGGSVCC